MRRKASVCWLQLSDLHIFYSTEWEIMLKSYEDLAKVFKPDFIVVTGDFRHKTKNNSYKDALEFLNKLATIFSLSKENFFFVPGNHDVGSFRMRKEIIVTIRSSVESNPDCYTEYNGKLERAFREYNQFIKDFYKEEIPADDVRLQNTSSVYCTTWGKQINIIALNTALISDGGEERCEIVDIQKLWRITSIIDEKLPTIVIAHHAPDALCKSHRIQLERFLARINARVYLCGDEHKLGRDISNKFDIGNQTVAIVCGKSTVAPKDSYSDICVIGYTWENSFTNVEVFKWLNGNAETPYQFIKSDIWYHHINKPFSFRMVEGDVSTPSFTQKMVDAWDEFLTAYEEEDKIINQKLGRKQIRNKSGNLEDFNSEKIMRSLIKIGIPFPAVSQITKNAIESVFELISANNEEVDTKTIRVKVLEAIRSLESTDWTVGEIGNWCTKYIRRYGHNNRTIQFCNIPAYLNEGVSVNDANFKFIKEIFLPDLFQNVCPALDMTSITQSQLSNLAQEIIVFINNCDLYIIDYTTLRNMVQEIITKPPHPWLINEQQRNTIIEYDRNAVKSNLKQIAECKDNSLEIPHAVFVELLHHTSAMMLDRYFSFCGCADLDAFIILSQYFKNLIEYRVDFRNWDLMLENKEIKRLVDDFSLHGISILDYYLKLRAIDPQRVPMSNDTQYVTDITNFASDSLNLINCFEVSDEEVANELEMFSQSNWKNYSKAEIDGNVGRILSLLFPSDFSKGTPKSEAVWWISYLSCYCPYITDMKKSVFVVMLDDDFEEDMLCCLDNEKHRSACNTVFFIKEYYENKEISYLDITAMLQRLNLVWYTPVLIEKQDLLEILHCSQKRNIYFENLVKSQHELCK